MIRRRNKDERGFTLALLALTLVTLIAAAGFAIDIGAWFLRTSQLQRAADAASLAGAAKMPDTAAALVAATTAAQRNGFVNGANNGSISITYNPSGQDQYQVAIKDDNAPLYFTKMFVKQLKLAKTSKAEFVDSVPMGSPFNALGMGDIALGNGVATQNYWLAVNGYCLPKEDGDLFQSGFDGTVQKTSAGGYAGTSCGTTLPGSEVNKDYSVGGYDYMVNVPESAGPVSIQIYDGAFSSNPAGVASNNIRPSSGKSPDAAKEANSKVTTTFTLWDTRGTSTLSDDTTVDTVTFATDDPKGVDRYYPFKSVSAPAGSLSYLYRVQVTTKAGEANSLGVNAFGLRAVGTDGKICDSRSNSSCPAVYGRNAISLYANLNPGTTGYVDLYLAQISKNYAGKPLQVALWDPGEGAKSIKLLDPSGAQQTFTYQATPKPTTGAAGTSNNLDVSNSNVAAPGPNRSNTYIYNDRLLVMGLNLPTGYATTAGDGWWKLRYYLNSTVTERATWSASIQNGDPVHLVRQS